jgi:polysaccharide biosynthesis protein PslG
VVAAAPAGAGASVPDRFYGVVAQGPVQAGDYALMAQGGADVLRFPLEWAAVETAPGAYDWSGVDALVQGAAAQGIEPLPFVWATPAWLAGNKSVPPIEGQAKAAWRAFLAALADRYAGVIDRYQIWNEANFKRYWKPKPAPADYAKLLKASAGPIRDADPGAEILTGGVAPVKRGMLPWEFLGRLYRAPRVERSFDTVTLHPYAPELFGVEFQIRQALDEIEAAGDRRARIRVTELGWASEGPAQDPMTKGREGQARMLTKAFRLLEKRRRRWRITGVDWHSFADVGPEAGEPVCSFCPGSGLLTTAREPKPAWDAYASFARD